jgi:PAS domain S-box-containing protein
MRPEPCFEATPDRRSLGEFMNLGKRSVPAAACGVLVLFLCLAFALCAPLLAGAAHAPGDRTLPMSEAEHVWLDEHTDLRLGMWLGSAPILFRGEDGSMQGMVPDYVNIVVRALGLEPKRVRASSFKALWELARAREVDMVGAANSEAARGGDMLFSDPYLLLPIVIATRVDFPAIAGLNDLTGHMVAVTEGHVPHMRIPVDYPTIRILTVDTPEEGLQAVESGRADAFVAAEATVSYLSRDAGFPHTRIAAITEYSYRLCIGVRRDWPVLLSLVNRALASISEEERKGIQDYWTVLHDSQWMRRPQVGRAIGLVLIGTLALVGIFIFWNRRLAREIERRKLAEVEFHRAHEATQRVIESADVIIVGLDYAGHVRLFNRAGEVITGYSRDELQDRNWFDIVVPRERYPYVWDEFSRLLREGAGTMGDTFESPILTKNGETRHILWRNSITADDDLAVISFGTDITHRLLAEEELRLTQFAVDNAAMAVFRVRPSGRIVYANLTASRMLGYTRGELRRMTVSDVAPMVGREEWPALWERFKKQQVVTLEGVVRGKGDTSLAVEITAYHLLFKGTELAIAFLFDISERKRVETLREDVERLVRHDLRSPTLAVQTLFTLFDRADNLTPDQRELLESVKQASRRMLNIIDMSRALYKMEAGTYTMSPSQVDLLAVANSVIEDLSPVMRSFGVTVVVNLAGKPAGSEHVFMLRAEEMLCYALLSNLIKNAVEASPRDGVVTLNMDTGAVRAVSVHNQGVIPESIRESFFEKYVTSGKSQGTGLGTYTARLIATTLGGVIDFVSNEEQGTTITVRFRPHSESSS